MPWAVRAWSWLYVAAGAGAGARLSDGLSEVPWYVALLPVVAGVIYSGFALARKPRSRPRLPFLMAYATVPSAVLYLSGEHFAVESTSDLFSTSAQVLSALAIALVVERQVVAIPSQPQVEFDGVLFIVVGLLASLAGLLPGIEEPVAAASLVLVTASLVGGAATLVVLLLPGQQPGVSSLAEEDAGPAEEVPQAVEHGP
jgi:hypothetical protein